MIVEHRSNSPQRWIQIVRWLETTLSGLKHDFLNLILHYPYQFISY
ncbi:hypothetical protein L911_2511 [Vibrio fluvialis I21563]|nr:hypothetical protein L911_2511 [Vibrio fluvialis I21563]